MEYLKDGKLNNVKMARGVWECFLSSFAFASSPHSGTQKAENVLTNDGKFSFVHNSVIIIYGFSEALSDEKCERRHFHESIPC
jgi:hypothetical protein